MSTPDSQINRCNHRPLKAERVCALCGVYAFSGLNQYGVKTNRFLGTINDLKVIKAGCKLQIKTDIHPLDSETVLVLEKAQLKMNLSIQTLALGMYLYFTVFNRDNQVANVGICMCVAAKFLEHTDKKTVHKFRKYFKKSFQRQEYIQKEALVLAVMDFDLKTTTCIDFLLYYLSRGACFSSEMVDASQFQDSIIGMAKRCLYTGVFMRVRQEELAASILFKCRLDARLFQNWNWHLEQYTKIPSKEVNRMISVIKPLLPAKDY